MDYVINIVSATNRFGLHNPQNRHIMSHLKNIHFYSNKIFPRKKNLFLLKPQAHSPDFSNCWPYIQLYKNKTRKRKQKLKQK